MGRAPCCSKVGLHRGPWTSAEDSLLTNYIKTHGEGQWRSLPKNAGLLRCGKSCRLRWMNYLRPDIKRGNITPDEDDLIIRLHALLGNRWSLIAGRLPGRTDNEIKNYWNTHLGKKFRSQGTDPNTHKAPPKPKKKRTTTANNNNKRQKGKAWATAAAAEKQKVHQPKPVRVTSLSLTRNNSNASFESNLTSVSPSASNGSGAPCWQPFDQRGRNDGMMTMMGDGGAGFMIGGEGEDDLAAGLVVQEQGITEHPRASDQNMLDKLYDEYLQLIKADDDHGLDLDDHQARELDSFAESLLI